MKRYARWILLTTITLSFSLGGLMAQQGPGQNGPKPQHRDRLGSCLTILDLDEGQRTQIRTILEAAQPSFEEARDAGKLAREALRSALESEADACDVGAAAIGVHDARETLRQLRTSLRDDVLGVLSPEQQAKLEGCLEAPGRRGSPGPDGSDD